MRGIHGVFGDVTDRHTPICIVISGDDNTGRVVIWNLKAVLNGSSDNNSLPKLLCQLDHHNGKILVFQKIVLLR